MHVAVDCMQCFLNGHTCTDFDVSVYKLRAYQPTMCMQFNFNMMLAIITTTTTKTVFST